MDVPNRSEKESGFAAALMTIFRDMRSMITADSAGADYQRFQERLQATLEDEIAAIYLLMMMRLTQWAESSPYVPEPISGGYSVPAANYAANRAAELSGEIAARLEVEVNRIRRQFAEINVIAEQLQTHLDSVLAEHRAQRIAVTEISRAASFAEAEAVQRIERRAPVRVQQVWFTQDDELVCPVCGPLHMKGEVAWSYRFPDGPPAHPNCRCYKEQSLVPTAVRVDTSDPNRNGRRPSEFVGAGR